MKTIRIPADAVRLISTSNKGNQSKWRVGEKWVTRGYEGQDEVLASLVLSHSTFYYNNIVTNGI